MALRNIITEGDPILRKKCRPVDEVNDRIRMILDGILVKPPIKRRKILPVVHAFYVYYAVIAISSPIFIVNFCNEAIAGTKPARRVFAYIVSIFF